MTDHPTDAERVARWRADFQPKPGKSGPICSACGDEWPCEYWQGHTA